MSVVPNKYRGTIHYARVQGELIRAAEYAGLTTYQDVALIMGLPQKGQYMGTEVGRILGEISEDEVGASRPMLSALAVSVSGEPGPGFFVLARELGRLQPSTNERAFWEAERKAVYRAWRRPLPVAEVAQHGEEGDAASPRR